MNKQQFLFQLRQALIQLPPDEVDKLVAFYGEIIEDRIDEGLSEAEAVAGLGDVHSLAQRIIDETPIAAKMVQRAKSSNNKWLIALLLIVGAPLWIPLLIAAVAVLLALGAGLLGMVVALVAVLAAVGAGGLAALVAAIFCIGGSGVPALLIVGAGLILLGLAILLAFPVIWLVKALLRLFMGLLEKISSWFHRKRG